MTQNIESKNTIGLNPRYLPYPQLIAPTQCLPKLAHLSTASVFEMKIALDNLRALYFPSSISSVVCGKLARETSTTLFRTSRIVHGICFEERPVSVPDSGYASAEEDEEDDPGAEEKENALFILRADPFERGYALKWLTGFVGRSDVWFSSGSEPAPGKAELLEEAAKLINAFSEDTSASEHISSDEDKSDRSLLRVFSFPTPFSSSFAGCTTAVETKITIQLNDAPLSSSDHTSVGLQSWGSSVVLAERLCADPEAFSILPRENYTISKLSTSQRLRILELGAGTGLLSIATSKVIQFHSTSGWTVDIVATDYHPDVLTNLASNIGANADVQLTLPHDQENESLPLFDVVGQLGSDHRRSSAPAISVCKFDWERPDYTSTPFSEPFDVILAADVIYHPLHATWIKKSIERLLLKPGMKYPTGEVVQGGMFWLIIPIRTVGRHEGMHHTVENLFPCVGRDQAEGETRAGERGYEMVILELEEVARREGTGRADESGYKLYRIGWAPRPEH